MTDDRDALELALVKQIGRDAPETRDMRERLHDRGTGTAIPIDGRRRRASNAAGATTDEGAERRLPRGA